ncbi:phospholipase A2 [Volvox carteri f. nagariensis]|uniref:Phospholipase A2 n=1 Tax=Volvox carteri f. nagariensis TaxID=3068 RepID=D8TW85_VOLCA|nr:phospholipase A2 [Volvox carteri f. nagariensis]EFJ48330.1 phospholipase A2 [Volvox carteri f. nagariensis]|eukprot:XP_002950584.1 phospholipase A2 [Volvox carteri f. nagariensis]
MVRPFLWTSILLAFCTMTGATDAPGKEETPCAKSCHTINCNNMGIRYGRFCGVGHGGCPGVKPCDPVDYCCQKHDACVEKHSVLSARCHMSFLKCLDRHVDKDHEGKSGKATARPCPYSVVIPTMKTGIGMAMMFTSAIKAKAGSEF